MYIFKRQSILYSNIAALYFDIKKISYHRAVSHG